MSNTSEEIIRSLSKKDKELKQKEKRRYTFYNTENPGLALKFSYGDRKRGIKNHMLFHGGTYELSDDEYDHLMSRATPIYNYVSDGTGRMVKSLISMQPRFQLQLVR